MSINSFLVVVDVVIAITFCRTISTMRHIICHFIPYFLFVFHFFLFYSMCFAITIKYFVASSRALLVDSFRCANFNSQFEIQFLMNSLHQFRVDTYFHELDINTCNYTWSYRILCAVCLMPYAISMATSYWLQLLCGALCTGHIRWYFNVRKQRINNAESNTFDQKCSDLIFFLSAVLLLLFKSLTFISNWNNWNDFEW